MPKKTKRFTITPNHQLDFKDARKLIKYYKQGYSLIELSRHFHVDFSLIIYTIHQAKISRSQLHNIYEKQTYRQEHCTIECIAGKERHFVDKFFPLLDDSFTNSYYVYWKSKFVQNEEKKQKCMHKITHVRCSTCNKILTDSPEYLQSSL